MVIGAAGTMALVAFAKPPQPPPPFELCRAHYRTCLMNEEIYELKVNRETNELWPQRSILCAIEPERLR
jgi:hypothetical protein